VSAESNLTLSSDLALKLKLELALALTMPIIDSLVLSLTREENRVDFNMFTFKKVGGMLTKSASYFFKA
jgi:hypothetical protein